MPAQRFPLPSSNAPIDPSAASAYRDYQRQRQMTLGDLLLENRIILLQGEIYDGNLNSLELVSYLHEYAETGVAYTEVLKKIIEQNKLTDFDKASILPTSKKLKSLI